MVPVYSIVGYSNSGKTTLIEKLIPELKNRGYRVAVVKHDGHDFEIDKKGKDSYRFTQAGAYETGLISQSKAVLMVNHSIALNDFLSKIDDVDLILIEGYKNEDFKKIMIHRRENYKPLPLKAEDCFMVISDEPIENANLFFGLEDFQKVADAIVHDIYKVKKEDNLLLNLSLFKNVKRETVDKIWNEGKLVTYQKGTILYSAQYLNPKIFIQLSGKSFIYNLTHDGKRKIVYIFGKGILLNDHVMYEHASSCFCETLEESLIFTIPKNVFVEFMESDFTLTKEIVKMQEWKMWRSTHQLKNTVGNIYMEKKLAAKLWKLARDFGIETKEGIEIDVNLSITFLSDMLGAPRETTSRACKLLVDRGIIKINKKRIVIIDHNQLANFYKKGNV